MITYIIIGVAVVLTAFGYYVAKNPKHKSKFLDIYEKVVNYYFPLEWDAGLKEITKTNLKALMDRTNFSRFIRLKAFRPIPSQRFGIYELDTGRKGIGFELDCHTYTSEEDTKKIREAVTEIDIPDIVVQVITYASDNISDFLDRSKEVANYRGLNIDRIKELEGVHKERIKKMEEWARSPMNNDNSIFKARNFVNMVIILFPKKTKDSQIISVANTLMGRLPLNPIPLSPKRVLEVYSEVFREGSVKGIDYDHYMDMSKQISRDTNINIKQDSSVISIGDGTYAQVLSTIKFPQVTSTIDIANAFFPIDGAYQNPLPSKFLISLTIHIEDKEALKNKILDKARKNIKGEGKDKTLQKFSTNIQDTLAESREIISLIEREGERVYNAMWSMTVFEESVSLLEQAVGRIKANFSAIDKGGWTIREEGFGGIAFLSLLYSMPFQFDLTTKEGLDRYNILFSSNIQSVMPLIGAFRGYKKPIIKFFGRTGQVVGIDLFDTDTNFNACIIGPSGTGKSFLSNTIHCSNLQAGIKTFIVDKGGSYKGICESFGGEYVEFTEDANICLNFFSNLEVEKIHLADLSDKKIQVGSLSIAVSSLVRNGEDFYLKPHEDEYASIVPILLLMADEGGKKDPSLLAQILVSSLDIAFFRKRFNAGMADLVQALIDQEKSYRDQKQIKVADLCQEAIVALEPYSKTTGRYYGLFNGAYSLNSKKDFMVVECDDLVNKGDTLYNIVIMSMLIKNAQEMFMDKFGQKKKTIVVDEALPLLKNATTAKFLEDMARRVRKHGGSLIVITQNTMDFTHNPSARGIWENSAHKFILALGRSEIETAFGDDGLLRSGNDFTKRQMRTVKNNKPHYSEFMYFYKEIAVILICKVSGLEYALFTSDSGDKTKVLDFQNRFGFSYADARKMLGYTVDRKPIDVAYKMVKEGDTTDSDQYWIAQLKKAGENKTFNFLFWRYFNGNKELSLVYTIPSFTMIDAHGNEKNVTYMEVEEVAEKYSLYSMFFTAYLNALKEQGVDNFFLYMPKKSLDVGVLQKIYDFFDAGQNYFLSISIKNIDKGKKEVLEFFKKVKELNLKIALVDVVATTLDLEVLNIVNPDIIIFKDYQALAEDTAKRQRALEEHRDEENGVMLYCKHRNIAFGKYAITSRTAFEDSKERGFSIFAGDYFLEKEEE